MTYYENQLEIRGSILNNLSDSEWNKIVSSYKKSMRKLLKPEREDYYCLKKIIKDKDREDQVLKEAKLVSGQRRKWTLN